jgi:predicted PurR-regulated permease PerM
MSIRAFDRLVARVTRKLSLRTVLIVPFVVQTVGAVTLVGYLSFRSGQQAVTELANQLTKEQGARIVQNLDQYLKASKIAIAAYQEMLRNSTTGESDRNCHSTNARNPGY